MTQQLTGATADHPKFASLRTRLGLAALTAISLAMLVGAAPAPAQANVVTLPATYVETRDITQQCNSNKRIVFGSASASGRPGDWVWIRVRLYKLTSTGYQQVRITKGITLQIKQLRSGNVTLNYAARSYSFINLGRGRFIAEAEIERWRGSFWSRSEYRWLTNSRHQPLFCHFR